MTHVTAPSNDLTEIAVVLDRSASMNSIKDDMDSGLWATILEQHSEPGRCRVSFYQFDDEWEAVFEGKLSGDVKQNECRLVPRGNTALNDAVVKSLAAIEDRILKEPETERPSKVAIVVITDGMENASRENDKKAAQAAIARVTEKFDWKFAFLAADPEGFSDGAAMAAGARGTSVAAFAASDARGMYAGTSAALSDYRAGRSELVDVHGNPTSSSDDSDDSEGGVGGPGGVH
jgi:Mg-chelatase subunit ChlD